MSDWWARRLGGASSESPPAPPQLPPYQAQQPGGWGDFAHPQYPTPDAPPKVTIANIFEAARFWRGGPGARNSTICPRCGGEKLFRRVVGTKEAAPLCEDCGWNPLWEQALPGNWSATG